MAAPGRFRRMAGNPPRRPNCPAVEHPPGPAVNRSPATSLGVVAIACLLALAALATGGAVRQLLWLAAMAGALLGVALGFVGLTVARAGAPRLVLSVLDMAAGAVLALVLAGYAVS